MHREAGHGFATLVEALLRRSAEHPQRIAYRFLTDGEGEGAALTYGELDRQARALAAWLTSRGLAGERALLLFPPGLDFVAAFLGCLYAGVIAVPAYPPRANRPDGRLRAIAEDARPRLALTTPALQAKAAALVGHNPFLADVEWLATASLDAASPAPQWREDSQPAPDAVAFLQYTSGSTSTPKGVVVHHRNLVHNQRMIERGFGQSPESVIVGWLPLYHDMGLIGNVLQPLWLGATCVLMSPVSFLQRPARWLEAISRYRATTSGGPNFAYDLCVQKVGPSEREGLDLSSWSVAFNGAEPVRAETLERFAEAFAPSGFRREAFLPCYGLAEATLFVTGTPAGKGPAVLEVDAASLEANRAEPPRAEEKARQLVSCGASDLGQRVAVVDAENGQSLAEGQVGEIWISGPSVAGGYWNRPEATAEVFGAHLESDEGEWLRTGDLGFLSGRALYVTGRLKDLIILHGRNLYPQDLEATAGRSHPGLRPGSAAVFTVDSAGEERLVLVQEIEREAERGWGRDAAAVAGALSAIRRAVAEEHEATLHAVILVRAGAVPKTSSGKIRRRDSRSEYLAGRLEAISTWSQEDTKAEGRKPQGPIETRLERLFAETLGLEEVGVEQDLFSLGADSLQATRLQSRINEAFTVDLSLEDLFTSPTISELAALLTNGARSPSGLPPEARSGGKRLHRSPKRSSDSGAPPGGAPTATPENAPLSFAQRRLWFLHQLEPGNPVHNLGAAVRLQGRITQPALAAAFNEIVRRHEALRTAFTGGQGEPEQVVHEAAALPLAVLDLSALPPAQRATASQAAGRTLGRLPFDLESGRLVRVALLRLGDTEHELILALHHIAADGGALAVLAGELATLYAAFAAGRPSPLPELPIQYADYAGWQRGRLTEEALAPDLAYWRERLAGELPPLELPADRPRPAVLSHRGAHHEQGLGEMLSALLEGQARESRATPFMVLVAGFAALLARYTGQSDLVLGTPIAGRDRVELEGLIGIFLNNLVLRLDLTAEPSFGELVGRVRETVLGAFAHGEVPFERLVDELQPGRDLSRTPLFQVLVVGQNAPLSPLELPGLRMVPREIDLGTARFDLAVSFAPGVAGWTGTWKLGTDLFDLATIVRLSGHLENLLAAALSEPAVPLAQLALLADSERQQVLAGWNDTETRYAGGESCLHELILAQAERAPDAVALEYGEAGLSYGELLGRAGELAGELVAVGVGPESLVGIEAYRSLGLVVGLLGVLVAGGAYVPLDPDYPADRLAFMAADAGLEPSSGRGALSAEEAQSRSAVAARFARFGLSLRFALPARAPHDLPPQPHSVGADHPAYAIYTSGSTGQPKGAVLSHRGIVNRLLWMQGAHGLAPGDRVLQKTPYSFDVSVWEFFWPLLTGSTLVMAPPGAHQDPVRLASLIDEHRVTTLHFVPSMLQVFLDQPGLAGTCGSLRRVFASGEALPKELVERFFERLGGIELHNLYGPTEASVDVTYHACRPGALRSIVPIGRPVANTSILVLDRGFDPVPVGVPGELYIGGVQLARGYLSRPGLTAERFVPDPYGKVGARLYKTGDLARFRHDGEVEFLGRLDHQVKIRGVRIELGEIESALSSHGAVREAVVLALEGRLVAYLVPVSGAAVPAAAELRSFLRESLPEAMIPSSFVGLAAFPLTGSGKVNRRALAALGVEGEEPAVASAAFEEPRTELERRLAALWSELLEAPRVGRHDSFFELGGDSIQGAMLVNRIQRELGEIVYVMALFDAPTVAGLAEHLAARYPESVARWVGEAVVVGVSGEKAPDLSVESEVEGALAELRTAVARRLGRVGEPLLDEDGPVNPRAVFLLSPFRSGSTLLRVMLAGHSGLFAPPELELLAFSTMGKRRRVYSGRDAFAREGLLRAVMDLRGVDADEAERIIGVAEEEELPVSRFYGRLQEWADGRLLVDKTPSYALDPSTLERAERLFDRPLYVHLVRHPAATSASYLEARMDEVYSGFPFPRAEQAELVWLLAHDNILRFLSDVPAERQYRLRFEDLLADPRRAMEALGDFLGVGFEAGMLEPYAGGRMTDGPRSASRMMGDPKFHQHQGIDARVAERSRVGEVQAAATRELALAFGYEVRVSDRSDGSGGSVSSVGPLVPVPRDGGALPLSFAQERLWFLSQLDPESPAYNMPAAVELLGALDVAALGESFVEVRRRHEILRMRYRASAAGEPVQEAAPAAASSWLPVIDLAGLPASAREAETRRLALAEGRRPFDLTTGPMLRTALLALSPGEHVLLVTLHHVVSDGWTVGVLMRELGVLYGAFAARLPSPLPPLPLQYADYGFHQRRWLSGAAMAGHLAYWRERLAGTLPPLELPTDRPRPPVLTQGGARISRTMAAATIVEVRAAAAASGGTLFLTLLAAFNTLLHRYSGQDDLLLGVPIANRNRFETEGLIGLFLNMVVQRTDASGDPAFGGLLSRVKEGFLGSIPHQEVPFEKLVEELQPPRDLSRAPIFQVQFSLQNTPSEELALPGLAVRMLENHNRTTKFDLTVFLFDLPDGLTTTLEYNVDLFDEATMARLLAHWEALVTATVAGGGVRLSELPMLAGAEREALLGFGNAVPAAVSVGSSLHQVFSREAALNPRAVAGVMDLEEISYGRLEEKSNLLAWELRELGVRPEVRVGLCAERSLDWLVGILGILKAGGAYVPLDPAYPAERLAFLLEDALGGNATPILVTQERLAERFHGSPYRLVPLVPLESLSSAPHDASTPPPALPGSGSDNAAYVIYTSGSTGRPKGVVVPHAQVLRLFEATDRRFGFGPDDVWTLFHSFAFDFSVWEIWGALLYGGTVVVVPREVSQSPPDFYDLLVTERVTVLSQTPSAFRQLVAHEEEEGGRRLHLRQVVFGGEALDVGALRPWIARHGDQAPALINMYGITETTVHVTYRPVSSDDLSRPGASPLGMPIPDLSCHLLGRRGELLPVGVPGEIHVGGAGVARGYLGRPELTAARFVPDPFSGVPGSRLYRSGDLARRRPDGDLEYLGRIDSQVKIRGFRIELGEIESALSRHPGVQEAVVMTRLGAGGDPRLLAWVVPRSGSVPAAELRAHLEASLPGYMVPGAIVELERLPLTAHGKVDRRALPEPEEAAVAAGRGAAKTPPATPTEVKLAGIWRELLGRSGDEVGRDDDFFELGGHSLLVAQLATRIRTSFGVELPLRALFEASRLALLAGRLDAELGVAPTASPSLSPRPRAAGLESERLPLSWPQRRLWFLEQLEPEAASLNIATALRLEGTLDVVALGRAVDGVVRRHETLRTRFTFHDGEPRQRVERALPPALPVTDLSALPAACREAEALRLARQETRRRFDLGTLPLLRVALLRLAEEEHLLVLAVHHIVADGWSMGVLTREISAFYRAERTGTVAALPPLPVQYGDYSLWQRERFSGGLGEEHLDFWRTRLAGVPRLELPTDHARPAAPSLRAGLVETALPEPLVEAMTALGRGHGATLFMVLLAGLNVVLGRHAVASDIAVGTPVANRDRTEVQGLIGLFLNTLVLRTDFGDDPPFADLLARVREATLDAFVHQELPFERVLEELQPERSVNRTPLFDVLLNFLQFADDPIDLPGLAVETVAGLDRAAKFDLTLYASPTAEGLRLSAVYRSDLFEAATIERLLGHLGNFLAAAAAEPQTALSVVPLLGPAESLELLRSGNRLGPATPFTPFPAEAAQDTLATRFTAQARLAPEALAVIWDGHHVTYGELDRWSNRVAHAILAQRGPGEERVALLFEPGVAMLAGLFGALKAGQTYVPLDPSYPPERLAFMLEDSASSLLVVHSDNLGLAHSLAAGRLPILAVSDLVGDDQSDDEAPAVVFSADSPAYILYTSGSTGRPKGVVQSHRNALHHARAYTNALHLNSSDRLSLLASYSFDAAVMDIFGALLNGAALYPFDLRSEGIERIPLWLEEQGITVYHSTPTVFRHLARALSEGRAAASLRLAVLGGEAVTRHDFDLFRRSFPAGCLLVNGLGPSESTIALQLFADHGTVVHRSTLPVGYPVEGTAIELRNEHGQAVDVLAIGELVIHSRHVALGYWQRPELTATAFTGGPGEVRAYRTGDLGRRLLDGSIEFLGRRDFQVKIRGHRVELGEIEATLAGCPGVGEVAVIVRADRSGEPRLVGYVVARPGEEPASVERLRAWARQSLPEPMVPSAWVLLDELPLTPTRKVDRAALPEPDFATPPGAGELRAPRTPVEEVLAAIWCELLQIERVGIEQSFFDLGGHSLLATQVVARMRSLFGVEVSLRQLFETPTVAGLAAAVQAARSAQERPAAPAIRPIPRQAGLPLAYAQERLWFLDRLARGAGLYTMPFALRLRGAVDAAVLEASLGEIVRRHEILRTRFVATSGRPKQVIDPDWRPALPRLDLGALPPAARVEELRRLMVGDEGPTFDLAAGPLLRTFLVREAEGELVLLATLHHIVTDGWSMGILLRELGAIYPALARGEAPSLAELPVQYADFAVWQREWLSGAVLDGQLGYWTRQLSGLAPLNLPADRAPEAGQLFLAGEHGLSVPTARVEQLQALARRQGASLFMVLLATFQVLLHRHSGQDDVAVGAPIANRNRQEIEPLIGFFVNTLALRTRLSGSLSFADVLERVREVTLGAYDHQDLPFSMLVEALQPDRRDGASALVEAMFTLQNHPMPKVELPGLELSPLSRAEGALATQFALVLALWESAGTWVGTLSYNAALFDRSTAARWREHWLNLLAAVIEDPGRPVGELPLLGESERHQVLYEGREGTEVVLVGEVPAPIGIWGELCRWADGRVLARTGRRARRRTDGSFEVRAPAAPASAAEEPAPTVQSPLPETMTAVRSELARRRDGLTAAQRELLARRLGR